MLSFVNSKAKTRGSKTAVYFREHGDDGGRENCHGRTGAVSSFGQRARP